MTDLQLMPGLSASALMALYPTAAGGILVYRQNSTAGVTKLLKKTFDFRRIKAKRWYFPILLLMPAVGVVVYALMRWINMALQSSQTALLPALPMLLAFFVGAPGEELGWSGYVLDPMQIGGVACIAGRHCCGGGCIHLASLADALDETHTDMDCVVVPVRHGITDLDRLALQQHG